MKFTFRNDSSAAARISSDAAGSCAQFKRRVAENAGQPVGKVCHRQIQILRAIERGAFNCGIILARELVDGALGALHGGLRHHQAGFEQGSGDPKTDLGSCRSAHRPFVKAFGKL